NKPAICKRLSSLRAVIVAGVRQVQCRSRPPRSLAHARDDKPVLSGAPAPSPAQCWRRAAEGGATFRRNVSLVVARFHRTGGRPRPPSRATARLSAQDSAAPAARADEGVRPSWNVRTLIIPCATATRCLQSPPSLVVSPMKVSQLFDGRTPSSAQPRDS